MRHAVRCTPTGSTLGATLPLTQLRWHSSRPPARLKMIVVKALHLQVEVREPQQCTAAIPTHSATPIHPACALYPWRIPRGDAKPQRSASWVVINVTRDVFTQVNGPLGTLYTAQTRKPSAFAAAHVPMSDAVAGLHISQGRAKNNLEHCRNDTARLSMRLSWVHPESAH